MDKLLQMWLDASPVVGSDDVRHTVTNALAHWKAVPPGVAVEVAGLVEPFQDGLPDVWRTAFAAELAAMEAYWEEMQQTIADRHVTVYTLDDERVGYTFCGTQNDDRMRFKWILCGTEQFTTDFQNVVKERDKEMFNKRYATVKGSTPFREVNALDEKYNAHRYQRLVKFSAPQDDSGWVHLMNQTDR